MGRWIVALLLSLGLVGAGYYVAWEWGWPALGRARESGDWPRTQGGIEHSRVVIFSPTGGRVKPRLELAYTYVVDGTTYTGHRVRLPGPLDLGLGDDPQQLAARYPSGLQVDVHYDPQDPSRAVLEPGAPPEAYLPVVVGVVTGLAGLAALGAALRTAAHATRRRATASRRTASSGRSRRR